MKNSVNYKDILYNSDNAYALHKIICDDSGKPVDYIFLDVNPAFETLTGLSAKKIINKTVRKVLPSITDGTFNWIEEYGKVALEGKELNFEEYSKPLKHWYKVKAFSNTKGYFVTIFNNVTQDINLVNQASVLNEYNADNIDYQNILKTAISISGADYGAINKFELPSQDFTTIAFEGIRNEIRQASQFLGFELVGKKWKRDKNRELKTLGNKVTIFNSLYELAGNNFPKSLSNLITKIFNLDKIVIVKTTKGTKTVGDFTLLFKKGKEFRNRKTLELYADIVGATMVRVDSEKDLDIQKNELANFFDVNLGMLCITDNDGYFIKINNKWEKLFGYTANEIIGKKYIDFVHPDDIDSTNEEAKNLLVKKQNQGFINRFRCKDGSYKHLEWSSRVVGNLVYSSANDYTKSVQYQDKIKKSDQNYKSLIDNMSEVIYMLDSDAKVKFISDNVKEIGGYDVSEIVNKPFIDFVYSKDLQGRVESFKNAMLGKINTTEYRLLKKSGDTVWVRTTAKPVVRNNRIIGVQGILSDISDLKLTEQKLRENEEKYRRIAENISDVVFTTDIDFNTTFISPSIKNLTGYTSEQYLKLTLEERHPQDSITKMNQLLKEEFINENNPKTPKDRSKEAEFQLFTSKKELLDVAIKMSFIRDKKQNPIGILGITRNITDRKQAEQNLYESEEKHKQLASLYKSINDNLSVGIMLLDCEMNIVSFNPKLREWFGLKDANSGQKCNEVFPKLLHNKQNICLDCSIENTIRQRKPFVREKTYLLASGKRIFNITSNPILNETGEVDFIVQMYEDITERKQSEINLKESEERFKNLFKNSPVSLLIHNPENGEIISANKQALKTYGYKSINNLQKANIWTKSKYSKENALKYIRKAMKKGLQEFEWLNKKSNGDSFWNFVRLIPIEISNSKYILASTIDINKRKELELQLKKENKLSQIISNISTDFINVNSLNIENKLNVMLKTIGEFFDVDRTYIFEFSDDLKTFTNTHEWCANNISSEIDNIQNSPFDNFPFWKEKVLNKKVVNIVNINDIPEEYKNEKTEFQRQGIKSLLTVPILMKNRIIGILGFDSVKQTREWSDSNISSLKVLSNIISDTYSKVFSENQLIEQSKLQEIIMNIAKNYINMSVDDYDKYINKSLEEIGSFVKADRAYIFDYNLENNTCTNTYEWCAEGIEPQIQNLKNSPIENIPHWVERHKQGLDYYVKDVSKLKYEGPNCLKEILEPQGIKSLITFPMLNNDELKGFVGFDYVRRLSEYSESEKQLLHIYAQVLVNLYNRINSLEQLESEKQKAEQANRAKTAFLANMSHEIRTPLNAVMGFSELIENTKVSDIQKSYLGIIKNSANTLLGIINDILDLSKIEAGKIEIEESVNDIVSVLEEALSVIWFQAQQKKLELILNINPEAPRYIIIDSFRIKQILINLLSNATKFTSKGEIELSLDFRAKTDNRAVFVFSVRDTGIGIKPSDKEKLFKAFEQADVSITRQYGGTGLGLTISSQILKFMNSKISVESSPGKGSNFIFEIETDYRNTPVNYDKSAFKNINKVYIFDENHNQSKVLKKYLLKLGVENVYCFDSIEILISQNPKGKPDVVLFNYGFLSNVYDNDKQNVLFKYSINSNNSRLFLMYSSYDQDTKELVKMFDIQEIVKKPFTIDSVYKLFVNNSNKPEINSKQLPDKETKDLQSISPVILLAEDNKVNMMLTKSFVKEVLPNAKILEAENGSKALGLLNDYHIDLILMDVQMPVMDGVEATKKIRELKITQSDIPIVALTAGTLGDEKQKCLDAGMNEFIPKPITLQVFSKIINKYLIKKS